MEGVIFLDKRKTQEKDETIGSSTDLKSGEIPVSDVDFDVPETLEIKEADVVLPTEDTLSWKDALTMQNGKNEVAEEIRYDAKDAIDQSEKTGEIEKIEEKYEEESREESKEEPKEAILPMPVGQVEAQAETQVQNETSSQEIATEGKSSAITKFNKLFADFITRYKKILEKESQDVDSPIQVDDFASKIAQVYEKVRRIIDWKEENLVRRTVIERILKRSLISEASGIRILREIDPDEMAEPFVLEIIRSGYFKNGYIPRSAILKVRDVLEKYIYILRNNALSAKNEKFDIKRRIEIYTWIIEIAACEIEEIIHPSDKENELINLMTSYIVDNLEVTPYDKISQEDRYLQTYIAVHKALFNLDAPMIAYHLVKYKHPGFVGSSTDIQKFSDQFVDIWNDSKIYMSNPYGGEFFKIAGSVSPAFLILSDMLKTAEIPDIDLDDFENSLQKEDSFIERVKSAYDGRVSTLKSRLLRSAIYSTLSIFVAGGVSLFIFEVPIAQMVHGHFSLWAVVADLAIPTALMFILVMMIKLPPLSNYSALLRKIKKVVFINEKPESFLIRIKTRVRWFRNLVFGMLYFIGGGISLYFIYWVFDIARVPWTSLYINTANVALVVFAAMVIRQHSKEITVEEKSGLVEFILDFFSIPLASIGSWFASKWKEYNFVSVFFTALIDTPFSTLIFIIEDWREFIKSKSSSIH